MKDTHLLRRNHSTAPAHCPHRSLRASLHRSRPGGRVRVSASRPTPERITNSHHLPCWLALGCGQDKEASVTLKEATANLCPLPAAPPSAAHHSPELSVLARHLQPPARSPAGSSIRCHQGYEMPSGLCSHHRCPTRLAGKKPAAGLVQGVRIGATSATSAWAAVCRKSHP